MANTKSAKKAARQTVRRTDANKARRSRARSYARKVEEAIASGDKEAAAAALKEAEPVLGAHGAEGPRAPQDRLAQGFPARQARQRHAGRLTKKSTTVAIE